MRSCENYTIKHFFLSCTCQTNAKIQTIKKNFNFHVLSLLFAFLSVIHWANNEKRLVMCKKLAHGKLKIQILFQTLTAAVNKL